jgi:prepilin-type N-terminal cleavage/methylation domain-containing protein
VQNLKKRTEGFTIIEVLIVLAIAGLILLIVFLAVPALQRNSRNTQRREDVSRILAAAVESLNNSNWNITLGTLVDSANNMGNLSIYQNKDWNTGNLRVGTVGGVANADVSIATVIFSAKCSGETTTVAQNRSVAVLYRVEAGSGDMPQCEST